MTQPNLPDAAAQQQAAVEVFAQYEPQLYEAYLEMMLEWLAAVKTAMFAGGVAHLGLVPDPMSVFSKTPMWNELTDKYTEQVAREVLSAPYKNLFANGTLFESRPFVRNWIAERQNRLQHVPTEVFGLVQHVIDSATTNGASIDDVSKQVQNLFDSTDVQTWKNRARTVARTEVVGAYNGGLYDAFAMVVEADPETTWVKRWLATEDHRTRPDHKEADGQVVPWGQTFTVGGFHMQYPHDPEAPPQEVINCRCTMLLEPADEPTDMGNRGYKSLAASTFGFNPLEKRDHDGKWTKGGGLLKSLMKKDKKPSKFEGMGTIPPPAAPSAPREPVARPARAGTLGTVARQGRASEPSSSRRESRIIGMPEDWSHDNPDPRYDAAANGGAALAQFTSIDKKPEAQRGTLAYYSGEGFEDLNRGLARSARMELPDDHFLSPTDTKALKYLDETLTPSTRGKDVLLWRGMRNGPAKFGDAWNGDMAGAEWSQGGFSSTSADFGVAAGFTQNQPGSAILRVLLPKEVKVGGVDMRGKANFNSHEAEALLSRGVRYRVTADHGVNPRTGVRILDVEVVR